MANPVDSFVFFFSVIDPIGTVPVFIAVTAGMDAASKRQVARKAVLVAACILAFFIVAGELVLDAAEIPLSAFRVAGGIVLFLFALTMIFTESKPDSEVKLVGRAGAAAVYPLAVPSIASPGAMLAAVLRTRNDRFSLVDQAQTALIILLVLVLVWALMRLAGRIQKLIGDSGASVVSRVMGLILASIAVAEVLGGIKSYFDL